MDTIRTTAIILAAGQGKRMNSKIPKQYIKIDEKPVLYYSLKVFEKSPVDEVVVVVSEEDVEYCNKEVVERYQFNKVSSIIVGGKERYHSVYQALKAIKGCDYVLIHDGARPFITEEIIKRVLDKAKKCNACIVGMPVKDTIKIVDDNLGIIDTPKRNHIWIAQTPQVFYYPLIREAYDKLLNEEYITATDDSMVLESMLGYPVCFVEGSYENIKITTLEDIQIAETFVRRFQQ